MRKEEVAPGSFHVNILCHPPAQIFIPVAETENVGRNYQTRVKKYSHQSDGLASPQLKIQRMQ